jgi:hypothetical protein
VYAIQSFDDTLVPDVNLGAAFVDDASLTIVPEPATLALASLAGLTLLAVRRRK